MILIYGRKACEKEKYRVIGVCHLHRREGIFWVKISGRVFRRSETCICCLRIPGQLAKDNYMEELIIESGDWKKSVRIEPRIDVNIAD